MAGTVLGEPGTKGGQRGTSGNAFLPRLIVAVVAVGIVAQVSINALSRIADTAALGRPMSPAVAWGTELSSGAAIMMLLPGIWWAVGRLHPHRIGWLRAIAGHVAASLIFSILHVGLMSLMRYALWGGDYAPGPLLETLLYEYRKDSWSYALIALFLALAQGIASNPARETTTVPDAMRMLLIQDGTRRHHVPVDAIDHVEAAGNYVELAAEGRRLLHRATLAAVEAELGDRFVRIHRSRIVNRTAIRRIETNQSGDFVIDTAAGATLKGSRRYRDALQSADCL